MVLPFQKGVLRDTFARLNPSGPSILRYLNSMQKYLFRRILFLVSRVSLCFWRKIDEIQENMYTLLMSILNKRCIVRQAKTSVRIAALDSFWQTAIRMFRLLHTFARFFPRPPIFSFFHCRFLRNFSLSIIRRFSIVPPTLKCFAGVFDRNEVGIPLGPGKLKKSGRSRLREP